MSEWTWNRVLLMFNELMNPPSVVDPLSSLTRPALITVLLVTPPVRTRPCGGTPILCSLLMENPAVVRGCLYIGGCCSRWLCPFERPDLADLLVSDLCARLQVFVPLCAFLVAQGGSPGVFAMHISANRGLPHLQL